MQARQSWLNETEMSLWLWIDFPTWRPFRLANQNCLVFARLKEVDFPRISLKNADWWERVVLGQYQIAFSQGLELFMSIHVFCVSCLTPWMLGTGGKCSQEFSQENKHFNICWKQRSGFACVKNIVNYHLYEKYVFNSWFPPPFHPVLFSCY